MNTADLATIYDYSAWATRRIFAACAGLSFEQLVAPAPLGLGSLRGTLVHLVDAEHSWRLLLHQGVMVFDLDEAAFPSLAAIEERWGVEERAMRDYLAGLGDDDLGGIVRYTTPEGVRRERVLWHCLLHVVNHATQHRSEAAAILTGYGHSPDDLDFTMFLNER